MQRTVLDLVVEDAYGLWEVLWRLRTIEPAVAQGDMLVLARKTVADLHSQGLVALEVRRPGESERVPQAQVRELIDAESAWSEPQEGAEAVFIIATPSGEEAYYRS